MWAISATTFSAHQVGDVAEALEVYNPGVGAGAANYQLGLMLQGEPLHLGIINPSGFLLNTVSNEVI
jgi:hypothetical protein